MNKEELKEYLSNNPREIRKVLEDLNCRVKIYSNRIASTNPDGDNQNAVSIRLNNSLSTTNYTRSKFNEYEGKDFISLIQYHKECGFLEAINYICDVLDINFDGKYIKTKKSSAYEFLMSATKDIENDEEELDIGYPLSEEYSDMFVKCPHKIYEDDGVSIESQIKFEVSYDILDNRIVIPIRNDEGEIMTFKGRSCEDYKSKGIPKFIYYYPFKGEYYLYGLYENIFDIQLNEYIYIFESEKAVMQCDSVGINNCVAISKKVISDYQIKKILKLGKKVVLCLDKDVSKEDVLLECEKFNNLVEVYYLWDNNNLLCKKDSPIDKGIHIFNELLNNKLKYNGGKNEI